ncbi:MAG: hypothetical protein L6437_15755 [Kiritimatiellae bacterium]|nr:hypothetical protein [Verrucomicrobiota bacterium]MBU4286214.1 hypothetical protein [Verrucomicrobiota bacterium]MBU4366941.1 hypothetical protein [Verrucomicrobiota bacterium]MCG2661687.1 hypothetical protein [Kiritimatiellia bacterium]
MSLTKKQMQQWGMGAIGGAIVFFVIIQFVVVPMVGSVKDNRENTLVLREQLDKAREVIGRGAELQRNLNQTRADIHALATNMPLPVLGNYLLGREQQIRSCCAGLNMQITSVVEHDMLDVAGWNSLFKIYRVRVVGQAGINDLARYFHTIQKRNPLVSVAALNIVPQDGSPAIHNVSFVVAWLIWANPDKRPVFLMEPEQKAPTLIPGPKR